MGDALPEGWMWVTWEDILELNNAPFKRGPFGSALKKSMFVDSGYKVYEQYCPINDDCSFARYFITEEKFGELEAFAVKARDFLVSCSGVSLGRITQVPDEFEEGVINQAILRVRLNAEVYDSNLFIRLFRSEYFQKRIFDNATGSAIPNVKGVKFLKVIPVPLIPRNEQTRIAQKLDQLLAQVDTLKVRVDAIPKILKRFRQSVLSAAVSGKLTEEWRIENCLHNPREKIIGDISTVVRGGSPRPASDPKYFGGTTPWITVKEITKDSNKKLVVTERCVSELGRSHSRYIEEGTLLLSNSGATLGVPKITSIGGCINDGVVAILDIHEPLKSYLYYVLSSMTEHLRSINQGAAQPNLNTTIVKEISFLLPVVEEQKEIVHRVEQLFTLADQIQAKVTAAQKQINHLTQSILAKAFRGELVPQDPNDEPASVLLERIKAQREAEANGNKKTEKKKARAWL